MGATSSGHEFNPEPANCNELIYTHEILNQLKSQALNGNGEAAFTVADLYYRGHSVDQNMKKAKLWFKKAVKLGHRESIYKLAIILYHYWHFDDPMDELSHEERSEQRNSSFKLFRKAHSLGVEDTEFYLGQCYFHGWGTAQNDKKAFKWFKKCAKNGDFDGIFETGYCFYLGLGTKLNSKKAMVNFRVAAPHHSKAAYYLGINYLHGKYLPESDRKAIHWLEKSAEEGNEMASEVLEDVVEFKTYLKDPNIDFHE